VAWADLGLRLIERFLLPVMPMRALYRNDAPPGPGGRWLIDHISASSRLHTNRKPPS
jgi:hypothetical protein